MKIEDLIEKLEEEFDDVEAGVLRPDFNIRDIEGWGSMHVLVVIALIDSEYDVLLSGSDLTNTETISDLFEVVQKKMIK
jgi:acyl carrier protein